MYLTTANIRKHIQELTELNYEIAMEALDDGESWKIRIMPSDGITNFYNDAAILYTGSGKNRKIKKLKSKKSVYSLADRYGIHHGNIFFKLDYP